MTRRTRTLKPAERRLLLGRSTLDLSRSVLKAATKNLEGARFVVVDDGRELITEDQKVAGAHLKDGDPVRLITEEV